MTEKKEQIHDIVKNLDREKADRVLKRQLEVKLTEDNVPCVPHIKVTMPVRAETQNLDKLQLRYIVNNNIKRSKIKIKSVKKELQYLEHQITENKKSLSETDQAIKMIGLKRDKMVIEQNKRRERRILKRKENNKPFQVKVKTLFGNTLLIDACPSSSVEFVMQQIEIQKGISVSDQNLIYNHKHLNLHTTLSQYGINAQSEVNLVLAIRAEGRKNKGVPFAKDNQPIKSHSSSAAGNLSETLTEGCDGISFFFFSSLPLLLPLYSLHSLVFYFIALFNTSTLLLLSLYALYSLHPLYPLLTLFHF